jgi:hypothetical protein
MPGTNYTTNLRLANPSLNDTGWGTTVSSGMIDLTDQAIAGLATADVTSSDVTLTIVDGSAGVNSARNMFLNITGTPGVAREVIVPTNRKLYFVTNNCGQIATVKVSGQPGVAVPVGATMALRINAAGTDVAPAFTYAASLSLGTALPATSGGTGQSSFAVGDLLYASTTTAISKLTVGATDAVLTVAAGIPSWVTTLGVASGGTGAATLAANNVLLGNGTAAVQVVAPGTAGNVLTSAGGTWTSAALPVAGVNAQVYTSGSSSFTIPANVTKLKVTIVGGGGGSGGSAVGNAGGGGGGGGTAVKWLTGLTPFNTINYAVGSGGTAGSATPTSGGAGNPSSISSGTQSITTVTANGGGAGLTGGGVGAGGTATNGDLNMPGSTPDNSSNGGASIYSNMQSAQGASTANAGLNYGGGASSISGTAAGAAGATGVVIFEW